MVRPVGVPLSLGLRRPRVVSAAQHPVSRPQVLLVVDVRSFWSYYSQRSFCILSLRSYSFRFASLVSVSLRFVSLCVFFLNAAFRTPVHSSCAYWYRTSIELRARMSSISDRRGVCSWNFLFALCPYRADRLLKRSGLLDPVLSLASCPTSSSPL